MSRATISPASAAATTPVSRVQPRKTISSRVQRPRRSGRRHSEHRERAREQDEADHHDDERRAEVVPDVAPRQVRAEGDEDEDHDHLRDRRDERAHVPLVLRVHAEPEASMLPTMSPAMNAPR